jgi:hypothetical protein
MFCIFYGITLIFSGCVGSELAPGELLGETGLKAQIKSSAVS